MEFLVSLCWTRTKFFFEARIRNIISSDHEQTPAVASLDDIDQSILKRGLYVYALRDLWSRAQSIFDRFPDMIRIPLTASGDTALHVAVRVNSRTFVKELINRMTPEDLEIQNAEGKTAFFMAALAVNGPFLKIMIEKNQNLAVIPWPGEMLPVHLAASRGYHKIVRDLCSKKLLEIMAYEDIFRLFFMTISCSMYDVAKQLLDKYPAELAIARDYQGGLTALHMLARKHSEEFDKNKEASSGRAHGLQLFKRLWSEVRKLESNKFSELISKPSAVLFDTVKSGNIEAVKWILFMNRELLTIKDSKERNLLHYAVLYRQRSIFNFLLKMERVDLIIGGVDKDRNNVLHLAVFQPIDAYPSLRPNTQIERKLPWLKPEEASPNLISNIQMQKELEWLKEVENKVPDELRTMRNLKGKKPAGIIDAKCEKFSNEVIKEAKGTAKSGMVVATLIINVAFAAALTVPRDKTNAKFIVFTLANAVSLFTSSASVISFLSVFTTTLTKSQLNVSIYPNLILGLLLMFISISTMAIAFIAASFLILDHIYKWVAYVVASMALLPILLFLGFQSSLLSDFLYFFWYLYFS